MAEIQTELPSIFKVHMGIELDGATELENTPYIRTQSWAERYSLFFS
jgi:hypothetical protein